MPRTELTFTRGPLCVTRKAGGRVELARGHGAQPASAFAPALGFDADDARWLMLVALPALLAGDPTASRELVSDPAVDVTVGTLTVEAPLEPAPASPRRTPALF